MLVKIQSASILSNVMQETSVKMISFRALMADRWYANMLLSKFDFSVSLSASLFSCHIPNLISLKRTLLA